MLKAARPIPPIFRTMMGRLAALAAIACSLASGCSSFDSRALNAQGVRLFEQSRYTEAMQEFQRAIEAEPNAADGYYNLAATYHRMAESQRRSGDFTQAERYYYLALDRDPTLRECYRGLAVLLVEQDRSEEAFRLIQSWADRNPAAIEPRMELARLTEEFGDRNGAKQLLADALMIDPNNARVRAALGRIREQEGDLAQALANYQQSLAADPFQQDVSARVAALRTSVGSSAMGGVDDSRIVTRGPGPVR